MNKIKINKNKNKKQLASFMYTIYTKTIKCK